MNLKELIKEVERLNKSIKNCNSSASMPLMWIKETVEVVDMFMRETIFVSSTVSKGYLEDWQKLKKLLEVK